MKNVDDQHYGFKKEKGTRNAIFVLKFFTKKAIEMQKVLCICYINFQKAFDMREHTKFKEMLDSIGVIKNLFWKQKTTVQIGDNKKKIDRY